MNYTPIALGVLGMLGVLLHNLVQMNKINKSNNGNINLIQYFKVEVFSILISVIVVFVCVMAEQEIKELEVVGKWLGLGFVAIGYMGQSLLVAWMGKAEKTMNIDESKEEPKQ